MTPALEITLVDSHCHLDSPQFAGDVAEVIARARAAGVHRFLAVGTGSGPPDLEAGIRLADVHSGFVASVGVHPHDASKATAETFERLEELCRHPKVVALGEIGLDYHYDFSPRATQAEVFRLQLDIARNRLPIIIHTRDAWTDTIQWLRDGWVGQTGIMHCFTGGVVEARDAVALGFHLSFGGVTTFPKSDRLREALRWVPDEYLLVETDAPYLAPVPFRGKRNEPAFMLETVRAVARVRGTSPEEIAHLTSGNFDRLFPKSAALSGVDPAADRAGYTREIA